jgi:hypothetical protein
MDRFWPIVAGQLTLPLACRRPNVDGRQIVWCTEVAQDEELRAHKRPLS